MLSKMEEMMNKSLNLLVELNNKFNSNRETLLINSDNIQRDSKNFKNLVSSFIHEKPILALDMITSERFNSIVGNLPLGLQKIRIVNNDLKYSLNIKENWAILFKSLFLLNEKGIGIYLLEPNFLNSLEGKEVITTLNKYNFYINIILNSPEKLFFPYTNLRPIIVVISRKKTDKIFVAELGNNIDYVFENWKNNKSKNISEGIFLELKNFKGFEKYRISKQLDELSLKYKDFKKYTLNDLSKEINIGKELNEKENSVYIPKVGNSKAISRLKNATIKHQNLIQVVLDKKIVNAKYLALFFNTKIGKLNLKTLFSGSVMPHINKKDIGKLLVSVPSIGLQNKIIGSNEKLEQLKIKINSFEQEIALNPNNVESIQDDLNNMLNSLNILNESDKILSLIREGEHKTLEFKSTLRRSIEREGIPDSVIEKAMLKNLAGFMNSDGGILLVGVNDEGELLDLNNDGFNSNDDILKHVKNLIKRDFGPEFYDLINYKVVDVEDKRVLYFECKASKKPVFLGKEEEFYVRTTPATDKLSGKKVYEYIQNHFGGSK